MATVGTPLSCTLMGVGVATSCNVIGTASFLPRFSTHTRAWVIWPGCSCAGAATVVAPAVRATTAQSAQANLIDMDSSSSWATIRTGVYQPNGDCGTRAPEESQRP